MAAFRGAVELGADFIECDVHLSSDGQVVVIHDGTLDRTTDGHGAVNQQTLAELQRLDAGGGERVPLLSELVELVRGRCGLLVELKAPSRLGLGSRGAGPAHELVREVVGLLGDLGVTEQVCLVSFDHLALRRARELDPRLMTGVNVDCRPVGPAGVMSAAGAVLYCPNYQVLDPELSDEVHAASGFVACWTADDEEAIEWCRRCGADSVLTNRPRELFSLVRGGPRRRAQ